MIGRKFEVLEHMFHIHKTWICDNTWLPSTTGYDTDALVVLRTSGKLCKQIHGPRCDKIHSFSLILNTTSVQTLACHNQVCKYCNLMCNLQQAQQPEIGPPDIIITIAKGKRMREKYICLLLYAFYSIGELINKQTNRHSFVKTAAS